MSRIFPLAGVLLSLLATPSLAQEVLVSPGTVVFEDGQRSAELLVGNTGDTTNLYRLEPTYFRMENDGRLVEVAPPYPGNSAAELIRYSPRQFELPPGGSQMVRMATRLPTGLPAGEYRIHLRVTNIGEALEAPQTAESSDGEVGARIRIQVARAVRVLVRHGVTAGTADVAEFRAEPASNGERKIEVRLNRSGAGSSRGAYRIYAKNQATGALVEEIATGAAHIYSDLPQRRIEHPMPSTQLASGTALCVAYEDSNQSSAGQPEEVCIDPARQ